MQDLEDEPDDVQQARPVVQEVKKGECDKIKKRDAPGRSRERSYTQHECRKDLDADEPLECCEIKRRRVSSRLSREKTTTVWVHEPECKWVKSEIVPRNCLSKEEYIDFLATPAKKCDVPCEKKPVVRRVRAVSPRIDELAKPTRRRLILTLEERAAILPPQKLDNMIELIEGETALTPEQAEAMVRDRHLMKRMKKEKKEKKKGKGGKSRSRTKTRLQAKKSRQTLAGGDPCLDMESAYCQYTMAQRFVRSIFTWKCVNPNDDYRDIAAVILDRLSDLLDYVPIGDEDRKSQQMRILANVLACWISGILMEVAERNRARLEEECLRRKAEAEELAALEALEQEEEEALDAESFEEESDDEELSRLASMAASLAKTLAESAAGDEEEIREMVDDETQYLLSDFMDEEEEEEPESEPEEESIPDLTPASPEDTATVADLDTMETIDDGLDAEQQTEEASTVDEGTEAVESDYEAQKSALTKIASRVCPMAENELPFVTFAQVFDTLYCMIQCESENTLQCPLDNRIHRIIYEKFEEVVRCDDPELLTPRMKDVLDVVTGKIARWVRKTLNDQQIRFLDENPAMVESKELRDWSNWIADVVDIADDWTGWIHKVTCEASNMKQLGCITRGDWHDWTSKFEHNALLWRRTYLEAVHQQHHNTMMMTDRQVVKTGALAPDKKSQIESTIKSTNFESVPRISLKSASKISQKSASKISEKTASKTSQK